jgi:hypothetical protein
MNYPNQQSYGDYNSRLNVKKTADELAFLLSLKVAADYANDGAAAAAGIKVGEIYHTSGTVKIRLS